MKQKVALVSGSSRGIGSATAAALARAGYAVCINYIEREDAAEVLAGELRAEGCRVITQQADVADREAVRAMVARIERELGPVTLLVSNAGVAEQHLFQDISPDWWKRIFDVNLNGAFHCAQAVLPHMLHEHSGCMVFVSSIWGSHGASCETAYAATKHAIIGLSRSLAAELARDAGAESLILTHLNPLIPAERLLEEARAVFPSAGLAEAGAEYTL